MASNKKFKLSADQFRELIRPMGSCLATDKITVDGELVDYMYREDPTVETDSGWRFFSGTEDQDYVDDPNNSAIYDLNTIANYDQAIINYLTLPDESLFLKNLGKTLIENEHVNEAYRKNVDIWLDKSSWDKFKSEIRQNTADTLSITIGKHQGRKQIQFEAIIQGDNSKSFLIVHGFKYQRRRACSKDKEYYVLTLSEKIEKKFINKLKD